MRRDRETNPPFLARVRKFREDFISRTSSLMGSIVLKCRDEIPRVGVTSRERLVGGPRWIDEVDDIDER